MCHNFVICLWEPHLHKHCQADVRAVTADQNALEGSPMDFLVALAQQELGMSDVTLVVKKTLRRLNRLDQHGHHDYTTYQRKSRVENAQLWDYASPRTTAFHASCNCT